MAKMLLHRVLLLLAWCCGFSAGEVLRLDAGNFELAVQSYDSLGVLFYDHRPESLALVKQWEKAAKLAEDDGASMGFAVIDSTSPDVDELVASYGFRLPAARIFRRRVMFDFNVRQHSSVRELADALYEESLPAVGSASTIEELRDLGSDAVLVGFFDEADVEEGERDGAGPYVAFTAAAEQLRGYNGFAVGGPELQAQLGVKKRPAIVYIDIKGDDAPHEPLPYPGEWSELALADWVLAQELPVFGQLVTAPAGAHEGSDAEGVDDGDEEGETSSADVEYANKFLNSMHVKFIAFVRPDQATAKQLAGIKAVAEQYRGQALFGYITYGTFPQAWGFFQVDPTSLPALVFYDPHTDQRMLSPSLAPLEESEVTRFVSITMSGGYLAPPRSEPEPRSLVGKGRKGPVTKIVGTNFVKTVQTPGVDVLVLVTRPFCSACIDVGAAFELLGKALQSEPRIKLVRIDGQLNDLPPRILQQTRQLPAVLMFPSKLKPYQDGLVSVPMGDVRASLHELMTFVQKEGSFKDLRMATLEQIGTLAVDEDAIRASLEREERVMVRNHLREVYDSRWLDLLLGEVVFDGRWWHVALGVALLLSNVVMCGLLLLSCAASSKKNGAKKREKDSWDGVNGGSEATEGASKTLATKKKE